MPTIIGIQLPKVYTYLSGFNQSIVTFPNALGISLDNYLGSKSSFTPDLESGLQKAQHGAQKMVYDALYGLYLTI